MAQFPDSVSLDCQFAHKSCLPVYVKTEFAGPLTFITSNYSFPWVHVCLNASVHQLPCCQTRFFPGFVHTNINSIHHFLIAQSQTFFPNTSKLSKSTSFLAHTSVFFPNEQIQLTKVHKESNLLLLRSDIVIVQQHLHNDSSRVLIKDSFGV